MCSIVLAACLEETYRTERHLRLNGRKYDIVLSFARKRSVKYDGIEGMMR